jgi:DNA-binding response OmpR family regulator
MGKILIIEDDFDIGTMIKIMLEYHGYSVVLLQKAEKAEEVIRAEQVDLVIMDMLLSGVNGLDVCARIKQEKSLSHIPIIITSAHPNAKELSQKVGAADFIAKPFEMQEVLSKVDRLVQSDR